MNSARLGACTSLAFNPRSTMESMGMAMRIYIQRAAAEEQA